MRQAAAVLLADVHLTDRVPTCRDPEEFHAAMFAKLDFVRGLQADHGEIPALVAGDVTDRWSLPPWILREAIHRIRGWIVVPGQHDLPQHRLEAYPKSALAVLEAAGCLRVLLDSALQNSAPGPYGFGVVGFPWGAEPGPLSPLLDRNVALVHRLVYAGKPPFPGAEKVGGTARDLLRKMEGFDLVVTGDNHETFVWSNGVTAKELIETGKCPILTNPGSMMRTTAKQAGHEPCVFLWYADDNTVERVVLPHEKGVVSREHLEQAQARDERMEAFVARLGDDYEVSLSFTDNLRRFLAANDVRKPVRDLVLRYAEEEET